jgi:hypothetical protein
MVAVAAAAILFGGAVELPKLWILRQQYRAFAKMYGDQENMLMAMVNDREVRGPHYSLGLPRDPEPFLDPLAELKKEASYFAQLRAKYEHAARCPWIHVEPDPAPP